MSLSEQKIYVGTEGLNWIADQLRQLNSSSVLLVTGQSSFLKSGYRDQVLNNILESRKHCHLKITQPNPTDIDLNNYLEQIRDTEFDLALVIGGGSVIDSAKIVCFLKRQKLSLNEFLKAGIPQQLQKALPMIAVPTTSGTGSEATQFATFYTGKVKQSLDHVALLPSHAVIDPIFSETLPPLETAQTGIDALSQAIESHWSVRSDETSRAFSSQAIKLLWKNLKPAVHHPTREVRLNVAHAAHLAGRAIQRTRTTAPHALSYPLTIHFGVSHGQAVGLTLPHFLSFNAEVSEADCCDPQGVLHVREKINSVVDMLGFSTAQEAALGLKTFMREIGLATRISDLHLKDFTIDTLLSEEINVARLTNNPRRISVTQIQDIYKTIL